MDKQINVGLIGYGMAGEVFHAPVISAVPALRLAAVVERRGERSRGRYPQLRVVREAEALFGAPDIELVVVATPNTSHVPLAEAALMAGKHVVVDKPFAITESAARMLLELGRSRGLVCTSFQNRRWVGDFLTVRQLLARGAMGRVAEYEAHFDRFRPELKPGAWRERDEPGSGVLWDLGIHLVDQALALFGQPQAVSAEFGRQRAGAQADDWFHVRMHYPRMVATLKAGMLIRTPRPAFAIYGDGGSFVKYGLDSQEESLKSGALPGGPEWGREDPALWGTLTHADGTDERIETQLGCYQKFYENVALAIRGEAELAVRPEEIVAGVRIIELAKASAATTKQIPF